MRPGKVSKTESTDAIPDYEGYDYSLVWRGRGIEDKAEKAVVAGWATGETGIELAGGFGRLTEVIEKKVDRMFMLDYSLGNLRRASERLRRTTLIRAPMDDLPFDDDAFDFVALVRAIHHAPDPDAVLDEVVRVARDGATFVLGIANEGTGRESTFVRVTTEGHRIYSTPLRRFERPGLERIEVRGVGAFDNALGRGLERLTPLASLDVKTSRLWPAKPMLFVRYRVRKTPRRNEPLVRCVCGGAILDGRCASCSRKYGRILDLVGHRA